MPVKKAAEYFGSKKGNCAQAVLAAYAEQTGITPAAIEAHKVSGGGRAPAGECGAFFAVREMLKDQPEALAEAECYFLERSHSMACRVIKKTKALSCAECVEVAAEAMMQALNKKRRSD